MHLHVAPPTSNRMGFTLVELSIVLVILGLLVGGVLTGQSLIRAAELRSITTQYNNYITAINSFKDKYFALPGDIANAQSYWGIAHATPATCVTTVGTGTQTCNGNGDGIIDSNAAGSNEAYRFWQHLANAGLIEGNYSGVAAGASYSSNATNSPAGKMGGTLWFSWYWFTNPAPTMFDGEYGNSFAFGGYVAGDWPHADILKPEELWNIDTKMDDGKPATGRVKAIGATMANCTNTSSSSTLTADYLLTNTAKACFMVFPKAY